MTDEVYFFDSYALFETLRANPSYEAYSGSTPVVTKLNLFELFCGVGREASVDRAKAVVELFSTCAVEYGADVIEEAGRMWLDKRKRDLSMTDCVGYVVAKRLGLRFLTGDKEFEGMENVEFVK